MSTLPDNELDLEKLFLPAWAQEPPSAKHYATYEGGQERPDRRDRRGPRPPRRDGPPGEQRGRGPRPGGPGGDRRGPQRREGERGRAQGQGRRDFDRGQPRERRETPPPLPEVNVALTPDEKGVESLARQIRMTARAYPLFDIARLILQKPERYSVAFSVKKNAEGKIIQPLFLCALDDTLWVSEDEAVAHVLNKHFATFYQAERTATEPPKGKYTFVAQCGMSGVILGPPNYHDYQNQLRKLHAERFSRMPFEMFKSRVKIVSDEAVVKKWIEERSWKTEYVALNIPEPIRLDSREAVEKHFRETHKENIIKQVEAHKLTGVAAKNLRSPGLTWLVRQAWEEQKRFPLQLATVLSQQFAGHGLQFFKVNKTVTHVSVARPHFLDLETMPVSEGVKRIVDFINAFPKTTRRKLMEALAPAPPAPTVIAVVPEGTAPAGQPAQSVEPTAEQTAVIADLHWLIHQGHVIEFADGRLETAKKPVPRPPKPEKKAAEAAAAPAPVAETETATTTEPVEGVAESEAGPTEAAPTSPDLLSVAEDVAAATEPAGEASAPEPEPPAETPAPTNEPQH
ncbi:MAG TPA: hypothetical protein VKV04_03710 [Verrucomicrobiae bacterium]|nr:hypothetical protein [Verrucomicrobiae bacterium]